MELNRAMAGAAVVAIATLTLTACGSSTSNTATASNKTATASTGTAPAGLVSPGAFTVCMDVEFPPMESYSNGTSGDIVGFDVSAVNGVAAQWGVKVRLINTAFDGLLPGLQSGKCDAVWSAMYVNDQRQKVADAVPYLKTGNGVLVAAGNPTKIHTLDDLAGKRVAVAAGTDTLTQLQALNKTFAAAGKPAMQLQVYPKFTEEVGAVASGKADAMVEVDVSVGYVAKKSPAQFETVPNVFPTTDRLAVYVNKGSSLGPAITKAYAAYVAAGDAAKATAQFGLRSENLIK